MPSNKPHANMLHDAACAISIKAYQSSAKSFDVPFMFIFMVNDGNLKLICRAKSRQISQQYMFR